MDLKTQNLLRTMAMNKYQASRNDAEQSEVTVRKSRLLVWASALINRVPKRKRVTEKCDCGEVILRTSSQAPNIQTS